MVTLVYGLCRLWLLLLALQTVLLVADFAVALLVLTVAPALGVPRLEAKGHWAGYLRDTDRLLVALYERQVLALQAHADGLTAGR